MTFQLMNFSVYPNDLERYDNNWDTVHQFVSDHHLDGIELLIGCEPPPAVPSGLVHAVHLPTWMGWFRVWHNRQPLPVHLEPDEITYFYGASSPEELVRVFCQELLYASALSPSYATFHLCDITIEEYFTRKFSHSSDTVLRDAACFLNTAVSKFPGNEPPVRIAFENLWWPGLNFYCNDEVEMFMDLLEFENWCFLLDTGHLMNGLSVYTEEEGILKSLDALRLLSEHVIQAIDVVHLHHSASASFQNDHFYCNPPYDCVTGPYAQRMAAVTKTVTCLDQHLPFTLPSCAEIVKLVSPSYITHEFITRTREELSCKIRIQKKALSL